MKKNLYPFVFSFLVSFQFLHAQSGLFIDTSFTAQQMVTDFFSNSCVTPVNITFNGDPLSIAFFEGANTGLGLNAGIVLSTGHAHTLGQPSQNWSSSNTAGNSDADLQSLIQSISQDAAVLEFDLVVNESGALDFKYVFGSEEYPEWVGNAFNDVFAFFVKPLGSSSFDNIATVPGTNVPVSVNNVNDTTNAAYYINNAGDQHIALDGLTTVLPATFNAVGSQTYHVKIAIADVGDNVYDSGVFIGIESLCGDSLLTPPAVAYALGNGSTTVQFENKSRYATSWHWEFGDNTISEERHPEPHTFPDFGNYYVKLTTQNWCCTDSLKFILVVQDALTASIFPENISCYGLSDGQINVSVSAGVAPFIFSINNDTHNTTGNFSGLAPGVYTVKIQDAAGSVTETMVTLTEPEISNQIVNASICEGGAYMLNGVAYDVPGTYDLELVSNGGCTSFVQLNLNILPSITPVVFQAEICEGETYQWNGVSYMQAGVYEQILTSAHGCDSLVTLELEVLPKDVTELMLELCVNEPSPVTGNIYPNEGIFTEQVIYQNQIGCDSSILAQVTVHPEEIINVEEVVPYGFLLNGVPLTQDTVVINYDTTAFGCALTAIVTYLIAPNYTSDLLQEQNFQVQPNPFGQNLQVSFHLTDKTVINAALYDNIGRLAVTIMNNEVLAPGSYTRNFSAVGLSPGLYLLRIEANGKIGQKYLLKN
jgi:PKD repeat protein